MGAVLRWRYAERHRALTGGSVVDADDAQLLGYLALEYAEHHHFGDGDSLTPLTQTLIALATRR